MKILGFIAIVLLVGIPTNAVVNTEKLRQNEQAEGLHHQIESQLGLEAGNTQLLKWHGAWRSDWKDNAWSAFLIITYDQSHTNGKTLSNKGFTHARLLHHISDLTAIEGFVQKQFNDFISLEDRVLLGGGLRQILQRQTRWTSALGLGVMLEQETIKSKGRSDIIAYSTNYLSIDWAIKSGIRLTATTYVQFEWRDPEAFRSLTQAELAIALNTHLSLVNSISLNLDNKPPVAIRKWDVDLRNGLKLQL